MFTNKEDNPFHPTGRHFGSPNITGRIVGAPTVEDGAPRGSKVYDIARPLDTSHGDSTAA